MRLLNLQNRYANLLIVALLAIAWMALPLNAEANRRDRHKRKHHRSSHSEVITQTREVSNFTRVRIKGLADVEISFGSEFKVEVQAEEDVIEYLETPVSGRTLTVGLDNDGWDFHGLHWDSDEDNWLLVRITMPKLERLSIKGLGSVLVDEFDGDELEVTVSGVGEIEIRDFNGSRLELNLKGVSAVEVNGKVDELDVRLSGVGEANLRKLIARIVTASSSGMGDVIVHATERIDASASGFGDVIYYGNPEEVTRDERGFGDIIAKR